MFCNFPYLSTCLGCVENCKTIQILHLVVCGGECVKVFFFFRKWINFQKIGKNTKKCKNSKKIKWSWCYVFQKLLLMFYFSKKKIWIFSSKKVRGTPVHTEYGSTVKNSTLTFLPGGGVKPILPIPAFWEYLAKQFLPNSGNHLGISSKSIKDGLGQHWSDA